MKILTLDIKKLQYKSFLIYIFLNMNFLEKFLYNFPLLSQIQV